MRRTWLAGLLAAVVGSANAASPGDLEFVEGVLSRLTLERAAFVACADDETRAWLTSSWEKEIGSVVELLKQNGFPTEFVAAAPARFALDPASPRFDDTGAKDRFCAVLGDWKRRWELFYVPTPEVEVRRVLTR